MECGKVESWGLQMWKVEMWKCVKLGAANAEICNVGMWKSGNVEMSKCGHMESQRV